MSLPLWVIHVDSVSSALSPLNLRKRQQSGHGRTSRSAKSCYSDCECSPCWKERIVLAGPTAESVAQFVEWRRIAMPVLRKSLNGRAKGIEKLRRERRYWPACGQEDGRVEENVGPERAEHDTAPNEFAHRKGRDKRKPGLLGDQHAGDFHELRLDQLATGDAGHRGIYAGTKQ